MIDVMVTDRLNELHEDGTSWRVDDSGQLHVLAGDRPVGVYARGAWLSARDIAATPTEIGRRMAEAMERVAARG